MPRKKKVDPPPPGAPLWMGTYGDMVTLVLTFFVLLFAFSTVDKQKYVQIVNSLRGAMGGNVGVLNQGTAVDRTSELVGISPPNYDKVLKQLQKVLERDLNREKVEIRGDGKEIVVSFKEKLFFLIGSADILNEALPILNEVGEVIRDQGLVVRIEGHTCDIPIRTARFPSNWELSATRAANVGKYLIENIGVKPENISIGAYSQYRPMVPNTSEENRARNRRVDIVITNASLENTDGNKNSKVNDDGGRNE